MKECPSADRLRQWYQTDGVSETEATAVEAHVSECSTCQMAVESLMRAIPACTLERASSLIRGCALVDPI